MKLLMYGNRSVQEYKEMAERIFEEMKTSTEDKTTYSTDLSVLPWNFYETGKLVLYQTINTHQDFEISILIDDIYESMPNNPVLYFKTLFNFRGEGSLFNFLRNKGYMKGIKSHAKKIYKGVSFFKIRGHITEEGIKNLNRVINYIYSYIQKLKLIAVDKNMYDYIKKSYDLAFNSGSKKIKHVLGFMKQYIRVAWKYKYNYLIAQHKLLPLYDKDVITKFCDRLTLNNSVIVVGNSSFDKTLVEKYPEFVENFPETIKDDHEIFNLESDFYNAKYAEFKLKSDFITTVENLELNTLAEEVLQNFPSFTQMNHLPKDQISLKNSCENLDLKQVRIIY